MCGICGYIDKSGCFDGSEFLKEMGSILAHRGPDYEGLFLDKYIGLCHRRLSILDLTSKGHQPMKYLERYVIVFNGEIYNYLELKDELQKRGFCNSSFNSK